MTPRAHRVTRRVGGALWPYVAVVLIVLLLWDGAAYLLDPPGVPPARPGSVPNDPWQWLRQVPGGLRTHGLALLLFAAAMVCVLAARKVTAASRAVLTLLGFYATWSTIAMAGAWASMPDPVWTSPSKWAALSLLTIGLIRFPRSDESPGKEARA